MKMRETKRYKHDVHLQNNTRLIPPLKFPHPKTMSKIYYYKRFETKVPLTNQII